MSAGPIGSRGSAGSRHWALVPAVVFAAIILLLALPPLGVFFLFSWPLIVVVAALGIGFGGAALRASSRRQKLLAAGALVVSALGALYALGWFGYWFLLPVFTRTDLPPGVQH